MNETPPPLPGSAPKKSGMPTWAIVLISLGAAAFLCFPALGLLAAIAIPNFVEARTTAQKNACINNLRQIDAAKQQWALEKGKEQSATSTQAEVESYIKSNRLPACPAGGTYTINAVGEPPGCSIPTHQLPHNHRPKVGAIF